jgi:hypothetical protein
MTEASPDVVYDRLVAASVTLVHVFLRKLQESRNSRARSLSDRRCSAFRSSDAYECSPGNVVDRAALVSAMRFSVAMPMHMHGYQIASVRST